MEVMKKLICPFSDCNKNVKLWNELDVSIYKMLPNDLKIRIYKLYFVLLNGSILSMIIDKLEKNDNFQNGLRSLNNKRFNNLIKINTNGFLKCHYYMQDTFDIWFILYFSDCLYTIVFHKAKLNEEKTYIVVDKVVGVQPFIANMNTYMQYNFVLKIINTISDKYNLQCYRIIRERI